MFVIFPLFQGKTLCFKNDDFFFPHKIFYFPKHGKINPKILSEKFWKLKINVS